MTANGSGIAGWGIKPPKLIKSTKDEYRYKKFIESTKSPTFGNTLLGAVPSVVYNEDCVEVLKRFSDNHFDLAIVDPYGIG